MQPVLIKCLAYLTSVQVSPSSTKEDKTRAVNMLKILRKEKPRIEDYFESHSLEIIEELLKNMWDVDKFRQYFDTEVEYVAVERTIDHNVFVKSLDFIQVVHRVLEIISNKQTDDSCRYFNYILFAAKGHESLTYSASLL